MYAKCRMCLRRRQSGTKPVDFDRLLVLVQNVISFRHDGMASAAIVPNVLRAAVAWR